VSLQRPVVSVVRAPAGQVQTAVREAMESAGWRSFLREGIPVSIKVNLGWDVFLPGAVSAPWVVEGVISVVKPFAPEVFLVEADQVVSSADRALAQTGLDEVCRRHGVPFVNMSRHGHVRMADPTRLVLRDVELPAVLTQSQLITVPVMKTHNKTVVTGALKNQWGCLPALRHNFHPVLGPALVDINVLTRPRFAVMDATIGLEGNGPKSGTPKEMGLVLASGDLVALDTIAASLMGFDVEWIEHLRLAAEHGLGTCRREDIEVRGESVEGARSPFRPARHNAVSWIEMLLRQSFVHDLVFRTPLFAACCWGARRYYDLWELLVGRRRRAAVMRSSGYASQWVR